MDNNIDHLKNLIEQLKSIGFFGRLFSWGQIKKQLIDASVDLQKLISNSTHLTEMNTDLRNLNAGFSKDIELAKTSAAILTAEVSNLKASGLIDKATINELTSTVAVRDTTIETQKERIKELESDSALSRQKIEKQTQELSAANEELATIKEGLRKITERKNELEAANGVLVQKNEQLAYENKKYSSDTAADKEALNKIIERKNELETANGILSQKNEQLVLDNKRLSQDNATDKERLTKTTERKSQLEIENEGLRASIISLQDERNQLKQQNTQLTTEDESRREKYESSMATLNSIKTQIQIERTAEVEARNHAELERVKNLKETWSKHQENVKSIVKGIANKHIIEYIDKFPLKGDPDNTLKICDELVVFDAKSPGSDDLTNFSNYLKGQAENAKKYAKLEGVKKDIFFVVPSNTLEKLTQFVFNLWDYDVFIISVDSLEQVILSLKKIENYEFAESLSPEERDNICRILGKFAHLTKRRIQIDGFFAKQFIELAYKSEADLPKDFFDKVVEFEKSEKLNPPVERRAKSINTKELDKGIEKLKIEAAAKGIVIDDSKISTGLNELQLYQDEEDV